MATIDNLEHLLELCCSLAFDHQVLGVFDYMRDGALTHEVLVDYPQMKIGQRSIDQAVAETRAEIQTWAQTFDAPTSFQGIPVIYSSPDCAESPSARSNDSYVFVTGLCTAEIIRTILTGAILRAPGTPLRQLWVCANTLVGGVLEAIQGARCGETPTAPLEQIEAFLDKNTPAITEHSSEDPGAAIETAILLQHAFSPAFRRDFCRALDIARNKLATVPELNHAMDQFQEKPDDSDEPIDYASYGILSDAEDMISSVFVPVFAHHAKEWARLVNTAAMDPSKVDFEPNPDFFRD